MIGECLVVALRHNSLVPLYVQLKDILLSQIKSGQYRAGAKLPSERELAEAYDVSRMTARMAVQLLGQEGVVASRTGKGTFVSYASINQELQRLTSFSQEMEKLGLQATSRVIRAEITHAADAVARSLGLKPGAEIAVLERVRYAGSQPLAIELCHLNHEVCRGILERYDFSRESLYRTLQQDYGIRLAKADQTISARLPTAEEQHLLEIDKHAPVLSLTRTTYTELDQPIETVYSVYHGAAYQLRTRLTYDL